MGGMWVEPASVEGRPIYTTFHLQALGRLFVQEPRDQEKAEEKVEATKESKQMISLHIGLGTGTAVRVLQRHRYGAGEENESMHVVGTPAVGTSAQ